MYDDGDCLLAAITAMPDDDAPRLAFADWLEEHGDPERAELIQLQVRLADLGPDARPDLAPDRRAALASRAARLLARLPALPGVSYQLRRGLPVATANNPAAAAGLLRARPAIPVTGLRLLALRGFASLAMRPAAQAVRNLVLVGCRVGRGHTPWALAHSPHLAGLVRLNLRRSDADGAVAEALARNPALSGLTALNLAGCRRLALPHVPGRLLTARRALTDLSLGEIRLPPAVLRAWAADPAIAQLATLRLNRNNLGDSGALTLAMSPHLANLRRLELRDNGIRAAGAAALIDAAQLGGLSVLDLRRNPIPPAAAERLRGRFGLAVRVGE